MKAKLFFPLLCLFLLPGLAFSSTCPCESVANDISIEYLDGKASTKFLSKYLESQISSKEDLRDQFILILERNSLPASNRKKVKKALRMTKASIKSLNGLKPTVKKITSAKDYQSVLRNIVTNDDKKSHGFVDAVIGGIIDGIHDWWHGSDPKPPTFDPPGNDCDIAGGDFGRDCRAGLQILENCGAISSADRSIGELSCGIMENQEQMKCEMANMQGVPYLPPRLDQAAFAAQQCQEMEDNRGLGDPAETQTSSGN